MALSRSLTKKFQKLNSKVGRIRSQSASSSVHDGFISISFDATVVTPCSETENTSITDRSARSSMDSLITPMTDSSHFDYFENTDVAAASGRKRADTATSNVSPTNSVKQPVTPISAHASKSGSPVLTATIPFNSGNGPICTDELISLATLQNYPSHAKALSSSSSCYSSTIGTEKETHEHVQQVILDEDAEADQMAMSILRKVSVDDYVQELRSSNWCI